MRGGYNPERAARTLVDANEFGDVEAAAKWKIDARTIRRYRDRCQKDPEFAALVRELTERSRTDWCSERLETLRALMLRIRQLAEKSDSLTEVADAFRAIAESQVAADFLKVGEPSSERELRPVQAGASGAQSARDAAEPGEGEDAEGEPFVPQ